MKLSLCDARKEKTTQIPKKALTAAWYRQLARAVSRCISKAPAIPVTVVYVDASQIRTFNKRYRGIGRVTDVLSYGYVDTHGQLEEGEIIICPEQALRQRHRFKTTVPQEFARLFFHGLLHIYGYDHGVSEQRKKMRAQELCLIRAAKV